MIDLDVLSQSERRQSALHFSKAGEGNRTLTTSLEGWGSTIELRPRLESGLVRSSSRGTQFQVGEAGFEPAKAYATRFTVWPRWPLRYSPVCASRVLRISGLGEFELRQVFFVRCVSLGHQGGDDRIWEVSDNSPGASGGTRTHNLRFTKPGLCQLSYASRPPRKAARCEYNIAGCPFKGHRHGPETIYPTFPPGHSRRTPSPPRQFGYSRVFSPWLARPEEKTPASGPTSGRSPRQPQHFCQTSWGMGGMLT